MPTILENNLLHPHASCLSVLVVFSMFLVALFIAPQAYAQAYAQAYYGKIMMSLHLNYRDV